ncbi:uncharacterized protein EAE98_004606 [Botrytis deweyae]|uniref:Uncharacterized protein n=1 Tax=Botrytis deweyae TaxID=2478750 RepID=A0ABQ7IRE1_9HELO|nr:uncharacterized protein EAE98_004606 [Botrytis deweyae]KAF7931870.1 hypothetical protein EAE98_004606 [Botrytis deweyae]
MTSRSPIAHRENPLHAYPNAQTTHPITVLKRPIPRTHHPHRDIPNPPIAPPHIQIDLLSTWAFLRYKD